MARCRGLHLALFPLSFARPKERGKEKGGSGELLPLEIYVRAGARWVTYAAKAAPTQLAFGIATPSLISTVQKVCRPPSASGGMGRFRIGGKPA